MGENGYSVGAGCFFKGDLGPKLLSVSWKGDVLKTFQRFLEASPDLTGLAIQHEPEDASVGGFNHQATN